MLVENEKNSRKRWKISKEGSIGRLMEDELKGMIRIRSNSI
jgi:hypothetical protein